MRCRIHVFQLLEHFGPWMFLWPRQLVFFVIADPVPECIDLRLHVERLEVSHVIFVANTCEFRFEGERIIIMQATEQRPLVVGRKPNDTPVYVRVCVLPERASCLSTLPECVLEHDRRRI